MSDKPYDIRERTFTFAVQVLKALRSIPSDTGGYVIARQLARSGTSVGANVEEADGAESKADFVHKMGIALKESRETRYWLRLVAETYPALQEQIVPLVDESEQIMRILGAIIKKGKANL